ncbi:hypothetical protein C1H46_044237 [Malus baccata]|uniref:F-box domain-containing protein n=1 Tax=Malus baccata TaxID=106549 RepID=A0A540K7M6_MALBA|nr:hypothetical protein C1H46_044237 [Malus baccata]
MEHKSKLLATTSSEAQGACPERTNDRFSSMPDEVAHRILSLLSILDLIRFGTVSKRCRELHLSTPSLNFDEFNNWNKSSYSKQFKLLNSLDRFLVLRRDSKIQQFRIRWSLAYGKGASLYNELYRVVTWIHMAVRCNVEVLDLELGIPETTELELPSCIFLCGSLRSLSVHCNKILTVPSSVHSTNLQYLKLTNVTIDEGFCKWISCSCKSIKELHLEHVRVENITIESSSLESFSFVFSSRSDLCHLSISCEKLEAMRINWRFDSPSSRSFKVFAPNLKYLKWTGSLLNNQNLGNFMCLETAEIFLNHEADNNDFGNVLELLCSIRRVKVLLLSGETAKACGFNREFWKSQNLAFIDHLKEATIELSSGNNGMELVRYMLEDAKNLKEMVILHSPEHSTLFQVVNESKRKSAARVVFQEYKANEKRELGRFNIYVKK